MTLPRYRFLTLSRNLTIVFLKNVVFFVAERLKHFIIGTSNRDMDWYPGPTLHKSGKRTNYEVCAVQKGSLGTGTTRFECGTKGRYLIIQMKEFGILTLCEVEAYEGKYTDFIYSQVTDAQCNTNLSFTMNINISSVLMTGISLALWPTKRKKKKAGSGDPKQ